MRSTETLTRAAIAEAINRKLGLSRAESLAMVESILNHMSDALGKGENVKISGFGYAAAGEGFPYPGLAFVTRALYEVYGPDRLTRPMLRKQGRRLGHAACSA